MIYGKVGRLGHGKTMRAVVDSIALAKLRGGLASPPRCILASNIRINPPAGMPFVHLPIDGFSPALAQLMLYCKERSLGAVVLVDEVDEIWGAADWQQVLKGDRHRIKQSRHWRFDLMLTAQFVDQIEKAIRNIMEEVEWVRAWPDPTLHRFETGKRPVLIYGQRFRPAAVRELAASVDTDRRLGRSFHLYRREHERLYDTSEIVEPVNAEALCQRHKREATERHCPECHPGERDAIDYLGLGHLMLAASESPAVVALAR